MRTPSITSLNSRWRTSLLLALAAIAMTPGATASSVVFSNLSGSTCLCGQSGPGPVAEQFTPASGFTLLDVSAVLHNKAASDFNSSFYIFSDSGGLPGSVLTELPFSIPGGSYEAITSGPPTTPLTLVSGTPYWLAVSPPASVTWDGLGTFKEPMAFASSLSGPYTYLGSGADQFEVDGDPLSTPEPGVIPLAGVGFALLAGARVRYVRGWRRRNQSPRLP